jgi:trehalose utilization protein
MFARFCREIKKNEEDERYSLAGRFAHLPWVPVPVGFVCVVYWERGNETFRQSFALRDGVGNLLDETPATECKLTRGRDTISTAFFYASFPRAGHYTIRVYQNGVCIQAIPLEVVEAEHSPGNSIVRARRFRSAATG